MNCQFKMFLFLIFLVCSLAGCTQDTKAPQPLSPAMVVSISSDGQHVISSHRDRHIILWDLTNKTKDVISNNGNIYSAYFIRNSDMFIWQDLDGVVHIQKINGQEIKSFKHLPTYGHVITTDLKHYFSTDAGWNLYYSYGENLKKIRKGFEGGALSYGKLFNLSLSNNGQYLVTAGDSGPYDADLPLQEQDAVLYEDLRGVGLWDIATLKPIAQLTGNAAKTNATISPDGRFIVSGCENGMGFVWDSHTGNRLLELGSIFHGITVRVGNNVENWRQDKSQLIPYPKDLNSHHGAKLTTKFISDNATYFQFLKSSPYAVLYNLSSPLPIKYVSLGTAPYPSVNAYSRNASIDTAPSANILVTGQASAGGINVYKYHTEEQVLEKVWEAE